MFLWDDVRHCARKFVCQSPDYVRLRLWALPLDIALASVEDWVNCWSPRWLVNHLRIPSRTIIMSAWHICVRDEGRSTAWAEKISINLAIIAMKNVKNQTKSPAANCQTCVRLRLQCLGFGEKRPDLMHVRLVFFFLYRVSQHSCREIMLLNFERRLRTFSTLRARLRTVLASRAPPATMESLVMKTKRICVLMLL